MNDGQSARQQIVEKIKSSSNILVTVSSNPTVDELSAALGLTSMLNGLKKHATAVVSGDIPPAITFLEPAKTFENTVDSLRDFIIALDKEKADHLRYKVDGDVVKIFITPYRTTITQEDLDFSMGDYNVELVLALGVKDKDGLDKALQAHGKILHDATVATLSCGENPSELGSIDWFEPNASSLSEMLVSVSEALKGDKPILDEQIATAFLTGIVAATDRFSNNKTSSKVMTMAAQLMAAGANQQLIAAKLEEGHAIGATKQEQSSSNDDDQNSDGTTTLSEGESTKLSKPKKSNDGELAINHELDGTLDEVARQTAAEHQAEAAKTAEEELAEQLSSVAPAASQPPAGDLNQELAAASVEEKTEDTAPQTPALPPVIESDSQSSDDEPSLGGTLNATSEQAQHDKQREIDDDRNKTILSHGSGKYIGDNKPSFQAPFNAAADTSSEPESVDIFNDESSPGTAAPVAHIEPPANESVSDFEPEQPSESSILPPIETLEDIDRKNRDQAHSEAQDAVAMAYEATPLPSQQLPPPPVQQEVVAPVEPVVAAPDLSTSALPPVAAVDFSQLPPPPPLPNFQTPQGPLPPEQLGQIFGTPPAAPTPPAPATPPDPNQFKIPGQ